MYSKALGRSIDLSDVPQIEPDEVEIVCDEAAHSLTKLNAKIKSYGGRARATGQYLSPQDWQKLNHDRADAAALHQALLSRRRKIRLAEEEERKQRNEASILPTLSDHFMQVVRNEASPSDYQRWILQAELRRSVDIQRQLASGHQ